VTRGRLLWPAALGVALALAACNQSPSPPGKLLVVASVYPIYEFTRQVGGAATQVVTLAPPGVEPHDWEPAAQDVTRLRNARLFVYNGAGLEPWVPRLLGDAVSSGPVTVRATEGLELLAGTTPPGARGPAPPDPHAWLDPVLARSMVETIRAALAKVDGAHTAQYDDNARAFTARLQALHEAFRTGLGHCARREVVTSHAAFAYLGRRYGLTVVPVTGVSPESEPPPARLAAIVRFAREKKVKYIFSETLVGSRLAEALARETGAQTLVLNPIEAVTREDEAAGKGYLTLMEENLKHLRTGLDCK
jgi:zinc transport system substrate-binding protein